MSHDTGTRVHSEYIAEGNKICSCFLINTFLEICFYEKTVQQNDRHRIYKMNFYTVILSGEENFII